MTTQRIAVVTGANTGIGLETARGLAKAGCKVVITSRNARNGEAAVAEVKRTTRNDDVESLLLDLGSFSSIKRATAELASRHDRIHLLVNNAGIVLSERRLTADGFEQTFGVNHLGHFLWTVRLLPLVKAAASTSSTTGGPARIINLSSDLHRRSRGLDFDDLQSEHRKFSAFRAYSDSKLANILFTRALAHRLDGAGVVVHAVHPGVVGTRFGRDGDVSGLFALAIKALGPFLLTPEGGAKTSLHVALSEEAAKTSGLYWEKSRVKLPTKYALDDEAATKLWRASEALIADVDDAAKASPAPLAAG